MQFIRKAEIVQLQDLHGRFAQHKQRLRVKVLQLSDAVDSLVKNQRKLGF